MEKRIKYYAVRKGYTVGVFTSWHKCLEAIHNYPKPSFCFFWTKEEAQNFMENGIIPRDNVKPKQKRMPKE